MNNPPELRFDAAAADAAFDAFGFNCGPAAVCAVVGIAPDELRPHLGDFERKRYTNPTLMFAILRSLGVRYKQTPSSDGVNWPRALGLVRVQWAGPWTAPGVPIAARYRQTHWVASWTGNAGHFVFDVNALCVGGWITFARWSTRLVPWLLEECVPRASGEWWLTHSLEVAADQQRMPA